MMADSPKGEPIVEKTVEKVKSVLAQLRKIWEEIGYTEEVQVMYCEQAYDHIQELLNDMVDESEKRKEMLLKNVKLLMEQAAELCKELETNVVITGYERLPLNEVEQLLHNDVCNLQQIKDQRVMRMKELLEKEYDICKCLGVQPLGIDASVPSEKELDNFKLYLEKQEAEKCRLENIFTDMRRSIVKMMDDLGISPSHNFEHLIYHNPENFVFTSSNMTNLKELYEQLKVQVVEAEQHVNEMRNDLIVLWKYLDEPSHMCQAFLDSYPGYGLTTRNALSAEIKNCKQKRRDNIARYVTQLRTELENLWNLCKFGESQRKEFTAFNSHTYTEDLLTLHELEAERLRKFYETNKPIFELLDERENLWVKMKELMQRANDPDRFHNRGGQLLTEERERKTIHKKLPKIEDQLKSLIQEYENTHGEAFTINDLPLEQFLMESWLTLNTEKESIKKARKEAKDKSVKKTPLSASKRTPNPLNLHRNTPLSISKRKLLYSPSPNSSAKRRNTSTDKKRPTACGSKIRRSGRMSRKILQSGNRTPKSSQKKHGTSHSSTATDTTYGQFREHLKEREELRSSLLPEQILKNSTKSNIMKTPVRTPMKPLRKNLSTTLSTTTTPHKSPHSPKTVHTPRLATAPSALPIIF